jgi:hypothetical protein
MFGLIQRGWFAALFLFLKMFKPNMNGGVKDSRFKHRK